MIKLKFLNKPLNEFWLWAVFCVGVAGFATFYLLPFLLGIYYSMFDMLDGHRFIGLANYSALFRSELFRMALANTARFTFLSLGLVFVVSFGAAYVLRFSGLFIPRGLLFLPLAVPAVSISFVWLWLFHHRGFLSGFFYSLLGLNINFFSGAGLYVPLLALFLWRYAGFSILIYYAGLSLLPQEYLDSFYMESNSSIKLIYFILLPLERPRTVYMLLLNLIFSMSIFREIYAVWANYPPRQLYMVQHFVYNNFIRLQYERAATGGVILSLFVLLLLAVILIWERRVVE
ncbi:MAG: sugar ABC transporter permease [Defluviitaleaceae bacterium]|nr:sugar ABC transporter permease [Defluviitaleaceae bacterium]